MIGFSPKAMSPRFSSRGTEGNSMKLIPEWCCCVVAMAVCAWQPAKGEVTNFTGSSSAKVIQFSGLLPVQSDFEQAIISITTDKPPAVSRARLDRHETEEEIVAAGQVVAIYTEPNLNDFFGPSDVGLDLGAFSDDSFTSWLVEATAQETRTVEFASTGDTNLLTGFVSSDRASSSVSLSGILLITANDPAYDLSGAEASIQVKVSKRQIGHLPETLLEGTVKLVGGPNGSVEIAESSGAFAMSFLSVVDFETGIEDLPLVRAVQFLGTQLPYEYDIVTGQPIFLDLAVTSQLHVPPGGVGAAAVFGTPMDGLASVLERIKKDDSGARLLDVVNQHVDTTGAAYVNNDPLAGLSGMCGSTGAASFAGMLLGCCILTRRGRRRTLK